MTACLWLLLPPNTHDPHTTRDLVHVPNRGWMPLLSGRSFRISMAVVSSIVQLPFLVVDRRGSRRLLHRGRGPALSHRSVFLVRPPEADAFIHKPLSVPTRRLPLHPGEGHPPMHVTTVPSPCALAPSIFGTPRPCPSRPCCG